MLDSVPGPAGDVPDGGVPKVLFFNCRIYKSSFWGKDTLPNSSYELLVAEAELETAGPEMGVKTWVICLRGSRAWQAPANDI